jgi:hypothetical protein
MGAGTMMTTTMKISDYATLVGQFDRMACMADGSSLAINGSQMFCPFGTLHLNQMVASGATGTVDAGDTERGPATNSP